MRRLPFSAFSRKPSSPRSGDPPSRKIPFDGAGVDRRLEGFRYREGDSVCFCLGVDEYSYLLLTLLKAQGCDKTVEELAESEDLRELLETLRIGAKA